MRSLRNLLPLLSAVPDFVRGEGWAPSRNLRWYCVHFPRCVRGYIFSTCTTTEKIQTLNGNRFSPQRIRESAIFICAGHEIIPPVQKNPRGRNCTKNWDFPWKTEILMKSPAEESIHLKCGKWEKKRGFSIQSQTVVCSYEQGCSCYVVISILAGMYE